MPVGIPESCKPNKSILVTNQSKTMSAASYAFSSSGSSRPQGNSGNVGGASNKLSYSFRR